MTLRSCTRLLPLLLALVLLSAPALAAGDSDRGGAAEDVDAVLEANAQCLTCHGLPGYGRPAGTNAGELYVNGPLYFASSHRGVSCTDCHVSATLDQSKFHGGTLSLAQIDQKCRSCHEEPAKEVAGGVHGTVADHQTPAVLCSDCHTYHEVFAASDPHASTNRANVSDTCGACHVETLESFQESFHGKAIELGSTTAATCMDCHSSHTIMATSHPEAPVAKANRATTCGQCHEGAGPNFAEGKEHLRAAGITFPEVAYRTTEKFFVWLTIIVMVTLLLHMELDLWSKLRAVLPSRCEGRERQ